MRIIQCTIHTREIDPEVPAVIHAFHTIRLSILTYHHALKCALELMRVGRPAASLTIIVVALARIPDLYRYP
jgi:hypothetical protein